MLVSLLVLVAAFYSSAQHDHEVVLAVSTRPAEGQGPHVTGACISIAACLSVRMDGLLLWLPR